MAVPRTGPQHELLRRSATAAVVARRPAAAVSSPLLVGRADEPAEREADGFADAVVASLYTRPSPLFRSAAPGADPLGGMPVGDDLHAGIDAASHGGAAVPTRIRRAVAGNGSDVSDVRIHTGATAGALSRSLQATAFTVGSDVFLGDDAPRPGSMAGDQLLAHELGHVVGAGGPAVRRLFGKKKPKPGEAVTTESGKVELTNGLSKNDKVERTGGRDAGKDRHKQLRSEITLLESALGKLAKTRRAFREMLMKL